MSDFEVPTSEESNDSNLEDQAEASPTKRLHQSPDILSACGLKRARRDDHRNESLVDDKIARGVYKKEKTSAFKASSSRGRKGRYVLAQKAPANARTTAGKLEVVDIEYMPTGSPIEVPLCPPNMIRKSRNRTPLTSNAASTSQAANLEVITLELRDITEMPEGVGLETPLHPKRRRIWEPRFDIASTSRVSPEPVNEIAPVLVSESAPSPAMYVARASVPQSRPRPHRRRDDKEIEKALYYGSDGDSDDDGDDEVPAVFVPQLTRFLQETPVDEPEYSENSGNVLPNTYHISDTFMPRNLYDFEWKSFPEPPIDPKLRREKFSQINVGPTVPFTDPYEIFISIWDRQFMEYIAKETNRYAQQRAATMMANGTLHPHSRICKWKETDVDELYVFFAFIISMGSVVKASLEDYWSTRVGILSTPGFAAYMSYSRFFLLMTCLHFRNNDDMCAAELSYSEAKLFKIEPILKHLNTRFQSLYVLGQNLSIDESLLLWKGWLDINQLIPNKAAGIGIKSFEICESQTGYLWRYEIHAEKKGATQQQEDILKTSTPAIVLRLIDGLENKGYTLWMDNYYNSPALARHLKSVGFDCVGTLRTNRIFVPQDLHNLKKSDMKRGQITGVTSGDVDVMVWRDANRVAMISTYHGNAVVRDLESTKPILIADYNIAMGGVDKKDQMLAAYPVERKRGKVWYKKLFKRLLNVSILNSFIIHRHNTKINNGRSLDHKIFRERLIDSLLQKHSDKSMPSPRPSQSRYKAPATTHVDVTHRLSEYEIVGGQRRRRLCTVCRKRVSTFCVGCNKTVCLPGDCFVTAHMQTPTRL